MGVGPARIRHPFFDFERWSRFRINRYLYNLSDMLDVLHTGQLVDHCEAGNTLTIAGAAVKPGSWMLCINPPRFLTGGRVVGPILGFFVLSFSSSSAFLFDV